MKNGNYEYTGWKANGFMALALVLAGIAASIYAIKIGVDSDSTVVVLGAVLLLALCLMSTKGFILMEPNEARVLTFLRQILRIVLQHGISGGSISSCRRRRYRFAPAT